VYDMYPWNGTPAASAPAAAPAAPPTGAVRAPPDRGDRGGAAAAEPRGDGARQ